MKIFTVSAPVGWVPGGGAPRTDFKPLRKYSIVNYIILLIKPSMYLSLPVMTVGQFNPNN